MITAAVILVVFMAASYCAKNCDGIGYQSRGIGLLEDIKLMYCFDSNGYNSKGYDKNGYDKDGYNEFGYDKFGYQR